MLKHLLSEENLTSELSCKSGSFFPTSTLLLMETPLLFQTPRFITLKLFGFVSCSCSSYRTSLQVSITLPSQCLCSPSSIYPGISPPSLGRVHPVPRLSGPLLNWYFSNADSFEPSFNKSLL